MAIFLAGWRHLISCSNTSLGPGSAVGKRPEKWLAKQAAEQSGESRHASGGWRHAFNAANPPSSNYLSLKCQNIKFSSGMFLLQRHAFRFRCPFPLPNPPLSLLCSPICFAVSPYFSPTTELVPGYSNAFSRITFNNSLYSIQRTNWGQKEVNSICFLSFHITLILNFKFLTNPGWS